MLTRVLQRRQRRRAGADDDYDPYANRHPPVPTTNFQALTHLLKSSIGTGVLAMPIAFMAAGWVVGVALTIIIGLIALHSLQILIRSMVELCRRKKVPYLLYSDAMKEAMHEGPAIFRCLAPIAVPFVDFFLAFYHFGICCVYIVFVAKNLQFLADNMNMHLSLRAHMAILIIPLLLLFSIRNLRLLAPFSTAANFLAIVGFAIILFLILQNLQPLGTLDTITTFKSLPFFFGVVLFSLEAVGVILAIEETMEHPADYISPCGIMNISLFIVIALYTIVGFTGYWAYGKETEPSITLNIPTDKIQAKLINCIFAVSIFMSYALQGYVTIEIVWGKYIQKHVEDESKHVWYELGIRYLVVILTVLFSMGLPNLGVFLALIGAFCLSFLGIIFPAVMQICVMDKEGYGRFKVWLIKDMLLILFGVLGGVLGTIDAVAGIVEHYQNEKEL